MSACGWSDVSIVCEYMDVMSRDSRVIFQLGGDNFLYLECGTL